MKVDKIINVAYSFGAAIVIFGAWAKMEHKTYSDEALTTGMMTEAVIFCLYGFMEWGKKPAPAAPQIEEKAAVDRTGIEELHEAVRQTNSILNKVFR